MPTTKVNYFLICENFVKGDRNRISLINIFDSINGVRLPIVPSKFVIAFNIHLQKEDIKNKKVTFKILITNSDNEQLVRAEGLGEVDVEEGNITSCVELSGKLSFKKDGTHTAKLFLNDKEWGETKFSVNLVKQGDET